MQITSVSGNSLSFHPSLLQTKVIGPGESVSFDVLFLPREEGPTLGMLYIHTSLGTLYYEVRVMGGALEGQGCGVRGVAWSHCYIPSSLPEECNCHHSKLCLFAKHFSLLIRNVYYTNEFDIFLASLHLLSLHL